MSYGDVSALRKDVKSIEAPYRAAARTAKQLDLLLSRGGGIADLSAQITFIKSLDPTSVVREGEVAMQQQASGLKDQILTLWDQATKKGGAGLTPAVRAQIQAAARDLNSIISSEYEQVVSPYYDKYEKDLLSKRVTFPEMNTPVFGSDDALAIDSGALDAIAEKYPVRQQINQGRGRNR